MSTLCAFFGIDDKPGDDPGHASAYLASESYLTYSDGSIKDSESQKVFTSLTMPGVFGYVGDERVADLVKKTIQEIDDKGLFKGSSGSEARATLLAEFFNSNLPAQLELVGDGATVIYIGKSEGAEPDHSRFHIWEFTRPAIGDWDKKELNVPKTSGPPIKSGFWGSGSHLLFKISGEHLGQYKHYSEFTWAYFRTLWEALRKKHDDRSGGTIQLVFLPRGGNGSYIGIIDDHNKKFVCGKPFSEESPPVSRWVDVDFDERDPETFERRLDRKRAPIVKKS
jgi:hypothetical protein